MNEQSELTKEEATDFFSIICGGEHHLPSEVKRFGSSGYSIQFYNDMATYDFNSLTQLVFLAHDKCIRAELRQGAPRAIKICIWKRHNRNGKAFERHPTIEQALSEWRDSNPAQETSGE